MGSRRIGRKRLYALNKAGEALTSTAGAAMEGNIGSQTRLRDGEIIATDITIDLASSAGAAHSFSVASGVSAIGTTAIGVSSSSGVHGNAQVMLINKVGADADSIGVLTGGELMCVEEPSGGGVTIGLWYGTNLTASGADMQAGSAAALAAVGPQVVGTSTALDPDIDLDNKYLYLVHSGSGADNYTAGKFVIRLYGYNVFDDV